MTSRDVALKILYETEAKNAYLNIVFKEVLANTKLNALDTAFVKELVFGVFRNKLLIDYVIRKNSKLRLKKIEPKVLCALRLAVYQILFMDKVPDHAVVFETVAQIKKISRERTVGFSNALLRSVIKNGLDLSDIKNDRIKYLSYLYSYPEDLAKFFIDTFGERAEDLMKEGNIPPKLCIRVNTLKTTREELKGKLLSLGIEAEDTPYSDAGLYLFGASESVRDSIKELFTVQDQSSQLVAFALAPHKDEVVLDLCSAPGGKTTHIAEMMNNKGKIFAFDLYEKRLFSVIESAKRLGIDIIKTKAHDATVFMDEFKGKADKVLLDVPCSGLGIIRRKPDIKYKEGICDFTEILSVQRAILETAKGYLKSGGVLVYSTCTVNYKENIEMVNAFLKDNPDFCLDKIDSPHLSEEMIKRGEKGYIELFPDTDKTDGFFVCRMKKL